MPTRWALREASAELYEMEGLALRVRRTPMATPLNGAGKMVRALGCRPQAAAPSGGAFFGRISGARSDPPAA